MLLFFVRKINLILSLFISVSLVCYILFLSLSNSLDFNIEKSALRQSDANEEYEQLLADLAGAQSKDFLASAGAELGLVETTLANGYVDIRAQEVSVGDSIVRSQ